MSEQQTRLTSYAQCPSCGAVMTFEPKSNSLGCAYCGSKRPLDKTRFARRHEYGEETETGFVPWGEVNHFRCAACGAVCALPDYEMSPECPFCNSANLIAESEIKGLKPTGVLPFRIDKTDAEAKYGEFIKKKVFAPSALRKNFKVNAMKGIYIPTFSFTSDTVSEYSGVMGKYYYVTVGSGKNRRIERRIRYFPVSGVLNKSFEDMQYEVSSHLTQKDLRKIGFFDVENALEYDKDYFAGFSCERYTESLDATWERAKGDMYDVIRAAIISRHNADVVSSLSINTRYANRRYQYLLAPVWKCSYKFKEKLYDFFINGRTGKSDGQAPVSAAKVSLLVFGVLCVLAVIIYFFLSR